MLQCQPSVSKARARCAQLQVTAGSTTPPIPAPSDNSCSGIITSANLEILTGLAYASNNVQRKVRGPPMHASMHACTQLPPAGGPASWLELAAGD